MAAGVRDATKQGEPRRRAFATKPNASFRATAHAARHAATRLPRLPQKAYSGTCVETTSVMLHVIAPPPATETAEMSHVKLSMGGLPVCEKRLF